MRKNIKVLVGMIAVVCLVIGMAFPAFAADEGKIDVSQTDLVKWDGLGNMNYQQKGNETSEKGCLGLGPVDVEHKADAYIAFTVKVDTAGTFTLTLRYAGSSPKTSEGESYTRKADCIVNGGERIAVPIKLTKGWNDYQTVDFEVTLKAGENEVKFVNSEDFDNSTTGVKAINIDALSYKLKADDAPTTDAPTTDAPATDAPTTDAPATDAPATDAPATDAPATDAPSTGKGPTTGAPKTGFITVALAIAAVGTGAYVISKRNH